MSLHQQPELKKAVLSLDPKEKDKLLVRLISKDKMLMKQLHFQLLEDEFDLEERIENLRKALKNLFNEAGKTLRNSPNLSYILSINRLIKQASGMINEHEKVTRGKMSEVEFRVFILSESIHRYPHIFSQPHLVASQKLYKYFSGRVKHLLGKYSKLHDDLQFDHKEAIQIILDFSYQSPMQSHFKALNLPKELD